MRSPWKKQSDFDTYRQSLGALCSVIFPVDWTKIEIFF